MRYNNPIRTYRFVFIQLAWLIIASVICINIFNQIFWMLIIIQLSGSICLFYVQLRVHKKDMERCQNCTFVRFVHDKKSFPSFYIVCNKFHKLERN